MVSFTAILIGFFLMLRKSNLVPDSMTGDNGFDQAKQLQRKYVRLGRKTCIFDIKWSKTNQNRCKLQLPLLPLVKEDICPISWLKQMVKLVPGRLSDPLFMIPDRYNRKLVLLTYSIVSTNLKKWVKEVTGDDMGYTLHGLRWGGVLHFASILISLPRQSGSWETGLVMLTNAI